jgi:predicted RNase H-like HicB family nuclease
MFEDRAMQIPVLIEKVPGNGYRARGGEPLALCAEGATRAEAVARLKSLIADRLAFGAELISLQLETGEHPLVPVPGWSGDDPLFDEWREAIDAYRHQVDDDPDR